MEVGEHGRAVGGGVELIAKPCKGTGADDVTLESGEQNAVLILQSVDVEVVHPEVDHDLVQLALAVHGADELLRGEIDEHVPGIAPLGHGWQHLGRLLGPLVAALGLLLDLGHHAVWGDG